METTPNPVRTIQEIWREQQQKKADEEEIYLGKLLAQFIQNYPDVLAMCNASEVKVQAKIMRPKYSAIEFSYKEKDKATRYYYATYKLNCGKAIDIRNSWTEHTLEEFADVLYRELFK